MVAGLTTGDKDWLKSIPCRCLKPRTTFASLQCDIGQEFVLEQPLARNNVDVVWLWNESLRAILLRGGGAWNSSSMACHQSRAWVIIGWLGSAGICTSCCRGGGGMAGDRSGDGCMETVGVWFGVAVACITARDGAVSWSMPSG
jgi:hypothetical protein